MKRYKIVKVTVAIPEDLLVDFLSHSIKDYEGVITGVEAMEEEDRRDDEAEARPAPPQDAPAATERAAAAPAGAGISALLTEYISDKPGPFAPDEFRRVLDQAGYHGRTGNAVKTLVKGRKLKRIGPALYAHFDDAYPAVANRQPPRRAIIPGRSIRQVARDFFATKQIGDQVTTVDLSKALTEAGYKANSTGKPIQQLLKAGEIERVALSVYRIVRHGDADPAETGAEHEPQGELPNLENS